MRQCWYTNNKPLTKCLFFKYFATIKLFIPTKIQWDGHSCLFIAKETDRAGWGHLPEVRRASRWQSPFPCGLSVSKASVVSAMAPFCLRLFQRLCRPKCSRQPDCCSLSSYLFLYGVNIYIWSIYIYKYIYYIFIYGVNKIFRNFISLWNDPRYL